MTFEEFFLKKKIDLDSLKQGKPDVFAEFVAHYEVMSEKSFDHTKKYWFNNLRIAYPLSEEKELQLKEAFKSKVAETVATEQIVEQPAIENAETTTIKAPAFKPRFKANVSPAVEPLKDEVTKSENTEGVGQTPKLAGFKPRFKAGVTASTAKVEEEKIEPAIEATSEEEKPTVAKPPGFKPRFKASVTTSAPKAEEKKSEPAIETTSEEEKPTVAKPAGFKPRFKAGVTRSDPKAYEEKSEPAKAKTSIEEKTDSIIEQTPTEEHAVVTKPAGFKPRFKAPKKDD